MADVNEVIIIIITFIIIIIILLLAITSWYFMVLRAAFCLLGVHHSSNYMGCLEHHTLLDSPGATSAFNSSRFL